MKNNKQPDVFGDSSINVPFVVPIITSDDKKSIANALNSRLLTDGPLLKKFEIEFAKFTGSKYAIGVSNATSALQLSLLASGIGKGDEVIIPDITFVATANAVLATGATPVIADIEKNNLNISVDSIKSNITSKTKAIIPVHFAGKSCNMKKIVGLARRNNLAIIEDCAHAIGTTYDSKHVGNFGTTGCFSFYPTKNMTTIEGGMIICNSKKFAKFLTSCRNHGISKTYTQRFTSGLPWDYDIKQYGYNFRLDEIRSALGLSQIKKLREWNKKRNNAANYYTNNLKTIKGIKTPLKIPTSEKHSWHLYVIKVKSSYGLNRNLLFKKLLQQGIRTSVHYKPLHKFTLYQKEAKSFSSLNNSSAVYDEILSLPIYPDISKKEQDLVIAKIKTLQNEYVT
tara:strand:- start:21109 stop:22299 length:1191 start_codon:yes stop_codon:yes gene_type:complete